MNVGPLAGLRCAYATEEEIVVEGAPPGALVALARTARGQTFAAEPCAGGGARLAGLPVGTHAIELRSGRGELVAEEFVSVRAAPGDDPIIGFATSFDAGSVPRALEWLTGLRCTVVQVYDWMERYSAPLGPPGTYRDRLGRDIDRGALERLITGIREQGAVAQAYAPICAADPGAHPQWRLYRNDGAPQALGDLLEIMDPASAGWQGHWLEAYGGAADALGFNGFHLDTYGYPRCALDAQGLPVCVERGYSEFTRAVRAARPHDVLSVNQVNGVPSTFEAPAPPAFRYVEVWPPNERWRHLESLAARSGGGGVLAIYPPVWAEERTAALRTAVLTEAVTTALGLGALLWGDVSGVLRHPYYVDHERLDAAEAQTALAWHRFGLRCRDLFRAATDTSWYELTDENAAVTVASAAEVSPEPVGGALFARVLHDEEQIVVSLLDLSGSAAGSWSQGTAAGRCTHAEVRALVPSPERWQAHAAVLGRGGGRFEPLDTELGEHREGRALCCTVPIVDGWSVLRLQPGNR